MSETALSKEHSQNKALEKELKDTRSHLSDMTSISVTSVTGDRKVSCTTFKGGETNVAPTSTKSGALQTATAQPEVGPSLQPVVTNLTGHIDMEVGNNIPNWLTEEQG